MIIEKDVWYWISDPQEGDIFYPIQGMGDNKAMLDGKQFDVADIKDLRVDKAVMPDQN